MLFTVTPAASAQKVATGILNIDSSPSGAEVYVDDRLRGTTPILLEVQAQSHTIVLKHDGFISHITEIAVIKDKVIRTRIKLKKEKKRRDGDENDGQQGQHVSQDSHTPNAIKVKDGIRIHSVKKNAEPGTVFLDTTPQKLTASINGYKISKKTPVAFDIRPGIYELKLFNQKNETVYQKTIFVRSGKTLTLDIVIQKKRTIDYTDPWK